ncbi:phosphoribosylaminoimidazolesuccinocarboxamide synthase [Enterococcus faecalis]
MCHKQRLLYEGKAKKLYQTNDEACLLVEYLDQVTALNGLKKEALPGKATLNNQITSAIFEYLAKTGIETHFIREISKNEQLVKRIEMFPLEVVVRNIAAGSFAKRLAIEAGTRLPFPVLEFYYKADELDDPILNEDHVKVLAIASAQQLTEIKNQALKINQTLSHLYDELAITLIDFKVEFGTLADGRIILADEVSPDTCRLLDQKTGQQLDKDLYRQGLGDIRPLYAEVLKRLQTINRKKECESCDE